MGKVRERERERKREGEKKGLKFAREGNTVRERGKISKKEMNRNSGKKK